jgi:gliding motility-associated lipoprotein GldH
VACANPAIFEENIDLPNYQWLKNRPVHITVPAPDTSDTYSIILNIRNNDDYPYRNIYLFVHAVSTTGDTVRDTVQYELADSHGNWLGKHGSYWIDHRLLYRSQVMFTGTGNYEFNIYHGMRADTLKGIGAVGIRIELQK